MITKNKEEIEKILKGCEKEICGEYGHICDDCQIQLQATIKTSIQWCEDEIEFLEERKNEYGNNDRFMFSKFGERLEQLQSHLKWLKQKEKEL